MKKTEKVLIWPDDPVVEEVRRARQELWKQAGGTVEGLMRLVNKMTNGKTRRMKRKAWAPE